MLNIIHKVVVHELIKEKMQPIRPSNIRTAVLDPNNSAVKKLVQDVLGVYGRRDNNAIYGAFRTADGRGEFPDKFENYSMIEHPTNNEFMDITRNAMDRLYEKAELSNFATGGYIVFVDYSGSQGRFFMVAMVKQKPGLTLTKSLMPEELMQLDLSKLYQAARVNFGKLSAYKAADEQARQELLYLSFISPSTSKSASGYFITALGCAAGATAARAINTVFKETRKLFRENSELAEMTDAVTSSLISLMEAKEAAGESIKLSEIGQIIKQHIPVSLADKTDELVDDFIALLNSEEHSVPAEFPINKQALQKHTHIKGESSTWKLAFDRSALGEDEAADIYYNREESSLTIRDIPNSMKELIEEQLSEPLALA